ncbi:MAG TPA: SDR family oxidoreductase [Acidimicrobiales bacterium]|nr:SDR family oxidoreductase [Acidimicrobiales bacterium]
MSLQDLSGTTAIVTGASRGFGRAAAISLTERGAQVVGVARNRELLDRLAAQLGDRFTPEVADAADPSIPASLIGRYRPRTLVLNAGATPRPASIGEQTWENFSTNWNTDVQHAFKFTKYALTTPLDPGSVVISLSSGAALNGSALSGGYAGAKATIRFISSYARMEAEARGLKIRFVAVLPVLTPDTDLGRLYTAVYAEQAGLTEEKFLERFGGALTADTAGRSISQLAADDSYDDPAYLLAPSGLQPVS